MTPEEADRLLAVVKSAQAEWLRLRNEADDQRRAAVTAALDAGISPVAIADSLGVTKARVYQIRDGR